MHKICLINHGGCCAVSVSLTGAAGLWEDRSDTAPLPATSWTGSPLCDSALVSRNTSPEAASLPM